MPAPAVSHQEHLEQVEHSCHVPLLRLLPCHLITSKFLLVVELPPVCQVRQNFCPATAKHHGHLLIAGKITLRHVALRCSIPRQPLAESSQLSHRAQGQVFFRKQPGSAEGDLLPYEGHLSLDVTNVQLCPAQLLILFFLVCSGMSAPCVATRQNDLQVPLPVPVLHSVPILKLGWYWLFGPVPYLPESMPGLRQRQPLRASPLVVPTT
eukprot:768683-Hanusia_phi.AAC.11